MKKIVLGIMVLILVGVLLTQASFATGAASLLDLDGSSSNLVGNNTPTDGNNLPIDGNNLPTDGNNTQLGGGNATLGGGNNTPMGGNNNSGNNLGSSYIYGNSNNNSSLPQTGLNNTGLFVLTAIAILAVVVTFKKMSDYGNI